MVDNFKNIVGDDIEIFCTCINPSKYGYCESGQVFYIPLDILDDNKAIVEYTRNPTDPVRLQRVPSELHLETDMVSVPDVLVNVYSIIEWNNMSGNERMTIKKEVEERQRKVRLEERQEKIATLSNNIKDAFATYSSLNGEAAEKFMSHVIQPLLDKKNQLL